ncbi:MULTISPECIES: HD domain-containing protein [unclassified Oceanispirochaeta]|uniref:HD domain-containing protein n=1 Tax=unclassified Oceanispirochaeta TaxID=2635722 RepID=UPI000E093E31|nr:MULTISPECIES: HD domain-containing protein [unclassified Oceanispirochaeta]MBF9018648.1 HD domain-containing protein [Oceanispirochaeta sp. M2]NPD75085.1 HD domain-containing protein [Oceanispirochaeta sp. M1]RDG29072.1 HD domain-containing protein [Oceanispirochaeta sp. M1]
MKLEFLNLHTFKSGELFDSYPWFGMLKELIENDSHHLYDSVFNHTVNVTLSVESLISDNQIYSEYFNRKVHRNSRKRLLVISALFHDSGKSRTYSAVENQTFCRGHEEVSCVIANDILDKIDMSETEKSYISNIIKYHGKLFPILEVDNKSLEQDFCKIEDDLDCFPDLYLFVLADINGSQLKDKNPVKYKFITDYIRSRLTKQILKLNSGVLKHV